MMTGVRPQASGPVDEVRRARADNRVTSGPTLHVDARVATEGSPGPTTYGAPMSSTTPPPPPPEEPSEPSAEDGAHATPAAARGRARRR